MERYIVLGIVIACACVICWSIQDPTPKPLNKKFVENFRDLI